MSYTLNSQAFNMQPSIINDLLHKIDNLNIVANDRNQRLRGEIIDRLSTMLLTDDERAMHMGLPSGCRVRESAKIIFIENLEIGENCNIAENAIVDASGGLKIGSNTTIGVSVLVWSHSSHLVNLKLDNQIGSSLIIRKPTKIGDGCFISGPSTVLAGSIIGSKCIIQPFSCISGNIPDRSIVTPNGITKGVLTDARIELMVKMSNQYL